MANQNNGRGIRTNTRTLMLAQLGVLTAIVVVLQILAVVLQPLFPMFTISLVLVPITIGAALLGAWAGGWLGLVFGAAVLISGEAAPFFAVNAPGTIGTVLAKGLLAGLAAGLAYKLIAPKSKTFAAAAAGFICPIVNTGIFVLGSYVFFMPTITLWAQGLGFSGGTSYLFLGMIGTNFFVELAINLVMIPVIVRLIQIAQGNKGKSV